MSLFSTDNEDLKNKIFELGCKLIILNKTLSDAQVSQDTQKIEEATSNLAQFKLQVREELINIRELKYQSFRNINLKSLSDK